MIAFVLGAVVGLLVSRTKIATTVYTAVAARLRFLPPAN